MELKLAAFVACVLTRLAVSADSCGQKADVVFIVDSSRSIWKPHFRKQLSFVSELVTKLNVGPDTTHVGVVSFSVGAKPEIYLNELNDDIPALQDKIKRIVFTQGDGTQTYEALRMAREEMFTEARGARSDVPQLIIIITDGDSSDRKRTKQQAQLLRERGIQVFAIGIGHYLDLEQLAEIATANTQEYVYTVSNFDDLPRHGPFLVLQACQVTTPPVVTTTTTSTLPTTSLPTSTTTEVPINDEPTEVCSSKLADVVFVLDKSSSITAPSFKTQLTFVSDLANVFNIAQDHTHVAVVTFDNQPKTEFGLTDYFSKSQIQRAIKDIEYTAGSTNTDLALQLVASNVLTPAGGARREVAHIVIVVTDGQSSNPTNTKMWASELKKGGAYVFAIGVGSGTDEEELLAIGSSPTRDYVHTVDGYGALQTIKDILAFKACKVPSGDKFVRCRQYPDATDVMYVTDFTHAGGTDVRRNLELIKNVTGGLGVGEDRVRVGLTASACPDVSDVGLEVAKSAEDFANAVTSSGSSATPLTDVLNRARVKLTTVREGAREGVRRLAVVFVHGPISDLKAASREILRAKSPANRPGVEFLYVGMGGGVQEKQMLQLAGERDPSDVRLLMDRPGELQITWEDVLNEICEVLLPAAA